MNFTIYDIIFLVIFVVSLLIFLYNKRKNVKKEGFLLLYKTSLGIKIINKIGKKYTRLLNVLGYISIILGFFLMISVVILFGRIVWIYVFQSEIIRLIKLPPIMPLLPYLPQIFKLNFLPPFYFTYWVIIIAIVAISHEFAHGVFAINKKVKVKSTGFGFFPFFLPVFLAAFVELDETKMKKKKILPQMAVLSAGTFVNVLVGILSFVILLVFFSLAFSPSGVIFDTYSYSAVSIAGISSINGISVNYPTYEEIAKLTEGKELSEIKVNKTSYFATKTFLEKQKGNQDYLLLYDDAPAVKVNLNNIITHVNGINVNSREKLGEELSKYSPGDKIIITALDKDANRDYEIVLGENPKDKKTAYLGIGFLEKKSSGILGQIMNKLSSFKDSNVYYKTKFDAAEFFYNLIWWLVLISFSVALINMLPVGIFDGGRFFYLTMLGITKSHEKAKRIFSGITFLFLALLAIMMIFWVISFFK